MPQGLIFHGVRRKVRHARAFVVLLIGVSVILIVAMQFV